MIDSIDPLNASIVQDSFCAFTDLPFSNYFSLILKDPFRFALMKHSTDLSQVSFSQTHR